MTEKNEIITVNTAHAFTPMTMIEKAMASDADVDRLEKLWELQVKFEEREAKKAFVRSMASFKSVCPVIHRTAQGQSGKFASLSDIAGAVDHLLAEHGLSYRWSQSQDAEKSEITVTCIVTHTDGHYVESPLKGPLDTSGNKNAIQSIGSSNAYLFRYTLNAVLGLASKEFEDDGKGADAPPVEVITDDQYATLDTLMDEVQANRKGFFTAYKIASLEMLPATMYTHAVKSLEAKRK